MLARYQQSTSSASPPPTEPTYGEVLLEEARQLMEERDDAARPADVIGAIAEAVVCAVEARGVDGFPPEGTAARESFARTYTTLVVDNDRQPPRLQIGGDDLQRPLRLLASFFTNAPTMTSDAQAVLRFIEDRFSRGHFAQARLLLQLFETDAATRRSNERNIFYEEMMTRLQSRRTTPVPEPAKPEDDAGDAAPLAFDDAAELLASTFSIRFHTFGRDVSVADAWTETLNDYPAGATAAALNVVPGPRWRPRLRTGSTVASLAEQFATRGLRTFVANVTRAAYFVTLSPGHTGLEDLIFQYVEWMGDRFSTVATQILPRLHRESTLGDRGIGEMIDVIWDEELSQSSFVRHAWEADELEGAFERTVSRLNAEPPVGVPEGEYDLGGLVAFELFGFDPGSFERTLRLSRLT